MDTRHPDSSLTVTIGGEELVLRHRYEVLSIVNDILIALWFIAGSVLFFQESTTTLGTWFFLIGSIELAIRPAIRLSRQVHLGKVRAAAAGPARESDQDF